MTKDNLVTVREGVDQDEAKRLLHQHRIEKLLVVDDAYRCVGLITVKDIEKAQLNPDASKDERAGCASPPPPSVGEDGLRARRGADRRRRRRVGRRHRARPFQRVLDAVTRVKRALQLRCRSSPATSPPPRPRR
jgi:IMP dehydrogenase